ELLVHRVEQPAQRSDGQHKPMVAVKRLPPRTRPGQSGGFRRIHDRSVDESGVERNSTYTYFCTTPRHFCCGQKKGPFLRTGGRINPGSFICPLRLRESRAWPLPVRPPGPKSPPIPESRVAPRLLGVGRV